jgi:mannonate dehydratase
VLGTVDGLKKFVQMRESPYHGLNFCQGTVSEMLDSPGEEIYDVIRWFGKRGKIFNVHFRNIRGKKLDFVEVFPDEGSVDMLKAMRAYKETGYKYMLMPDHVPHIDGRDPQGTAFAFCYGYIIALLQGVGEPLGQ